MSATAYREQARRTDVEVCDCGREMPTLENLEVNLKREDLLGWEPSKVTVDVRCPCGQEWGLSRGIGFEKKESG